MIRVHKIALDPNNEQRTYFAKASGTARFAYNWALAEWRRRYRLGEHPNEAMLRKLLNAIKRTEFPWMLEVSKTAPQEAIKQLGGAFLRFFRGQGGYPRFKRKGERDSYQADNGPGTFAVEGSRIRLPVVGWIRAREELRFKGELRSITVSRTGHRWFAAIAVETDPPPVLSVSPSGIRETYGNLARPEAICGVDLGVKALATLDDGTVVEGPKALRHHLRKLRRLNRSMARKVEAAKKAMGFQGKALPKGTRIPPSSNRRKAAEKLSRLHARIAAIRQDALHKLTTDLVRRFTHIGIEDLNVRGMMANDRLARAIADVGFHEFRRQLEYKAKLHGCTIVKAPRFFPSSKTCSDCGQVLDALSLQTRSWDCPDCGAHQISVRLAYPRRGYRDDRDQNAARNLARLCGPPAFDPAQTFSNTASSAGIYACGETGSGPRPKAEVKPGSRKQEVNVGYV